MYGKHVVDFCAALHYECVRDHREYLMRTFVRDVPIDYTGKYSCTNAYDMCLIMVRSPR